MTTFVWFTSCCLDKATASAQNGIWKQLPTVQPRFTAHLKIKSIKKLQGQNATEGGNVGGGGDVRNADVFDGSDGGENFDDD